MLVILFASEINILLLLLLWLEFITLIWLKISSRPYNSCKFIQKYELRGKKLIVRILYRSYGFCSQSLQV